MTWIDIVIAAITSGVVIAIVEIVRDWRNKRRGDKIKNNSDDYAAQKAGLDLVSEFYTRVKSLLDDGIAQDVKELKEDVKEIRREQMEIKTEQDRERTYLNGAYQEWLKNNGLAENK